MAENYEISLGIQLDDSELKNIKNQINTLTDNTHRIRIDIDNSRLLKQIEHAKKELKELNNTNGKKPSLEVSTKSLEGSLSKVESIVNEVKNSLGTLDDKMNTKNLITAVNQIATALEKATNESDGLVASLNTLAKKDFSVNLDIKMGGSNPVSRNSIYGKKVREEVVPELQKQIKVYEDYFADKFKGKYREGFSPLSKILTGSDVWDKNKTNIIDIQTRMSDSSNLEKQIKAYEQYISIIQQAASLNGFDVSDITSQFSVSAEKLVQDTIDIKSGVKETEEQMEKLKSIFNTGIDTDGLKGVLDPILQDLKAIKESIDNLSNNNALNGLTSNFERMSTVLEGLSTNLASIHEYFESIRNISSSTGNNISNSINQANQQARRLISDSAQESINDVSSTGINRYFRVSQSDSSAFEREMDNLVRQWTDGKGNLVDLKIDTRTSYDKDAGANIERLHQAQVTYNNALGETIKKTIAWRQIGTTTNAKGEEVALRGFVEVAGQYSKSLGQTQVQTDKFVKDQKRAAADLVNQINQINSAANDKNASRPIKEDEHTTELARRYNEITDAITRMRNASDANTFEDERIEVKRLISEYKSLVKEYRNAENVSTKMKGTDFSSGLDIAKNDLEKFKAEAKDFPQITATIRKLDKTIKGVGDSASLNNFNNQLRVARSELAKIKSETSAANRSEKVGINVSGLESKIEDLRKISPEIDKFEAEIDGAKVSVNSLLGDLGKVKTQGDFSVVNAKWRAFTDAAKAAGIAVTDTVTKTRAALANDIKIDIELGNFDNQMDAMRTRFNSLSDANKELRVSVEQVENAYESMLAAAKANTGDIEADRERLIQAEKQYAAVLEKINNLIKIQARADSVAQAKEKLANSHKSLELDMVNWLKKNSKAAKEYGDQIDELIISLNKLEQAGKLKQIDVNSASSKFNLITKDAERRGLTGLTTWDKLVSKVKEYSVYLSAADVFMYATQGLKDMFEQVKLIDSAMTELKKVTNETDAAYNNFLNDASTKAKEIGTTIDAFVSSTADFARLGYNLKDSQELAEVANIYAVVGDEIDSVDTATKSLISTMTAFGVEASNSMTIVDKFNIIGNNFAISSGGIGEALERSASSMAAANNTLDETIALVTAANTVVQDPEQVGRLMPTIKVAISVKLQRWTRPSKDFIYNY